MPDASHLAAAAALASAVRDATEPVVTYVGGVAAVMSALACALEYAKDEPRWDEAMGKGAVAGAAAGAALLLVEAAFLR